ncbi:Mur ligase family protein [Candidatus Saccharibacteria bacterium]|nr:MAG: Mur ligase family protein [Candidatus Saccharibacteria bacterium]
MLPPKHTRRIGKILKSTLARRGRGSALPGLVVEKLDPDFLKRTLAGLPWGVVVVSGTNGKTTTTKMVVQLLRASGLKVFTNPTGSNFTRGIVASLLSAIDDGGNLDDDIAILELDEAHAVHFVREVAPRYSLVLNVLRDQLDRFGEIDHTAKLLSQVIAATTEGIVLNREDPLVRTLIEHVPRDKKLQYFGLNPKLKDMFPSDQDMRSKITADAPRLPHVHKNDVILESFKDQKAVFAWGEKKQPAVTLKIDGVYNVFNAAAALTMARMILGDETNPKLLLSELSDVRPAFGRGEAIDIDGDPLEIVLVKNPSGFRLALASYAVRPASTMIAINDNYADGRDMSWLWDVEFESLRSGSAEAGVAMVSGIRAYDMALRLQYDDVTVSQVETDIPVALETFLRRTKGVRRIYCTYTAMLAIRRALARKYDLEAIE